MSFDQANNLLIEPARIEEEEVCTRSLLCALGCCWPCFLGCGLSRWLPTSCAHTPLLRVPLPTALAPGTGLTYPRGAWWPSGQSAGPGQGQRVSAGVLACFLSLRPQGPQSFEALGLQGRGRASHLPTPRRVPLPGCTHCLEPSASGALLRHCLPLSSFSVIPTLAQVAGQNCAPPRPL